MLWQVVQKDAGTMLPQLVSPWPEGPHEHGMEPLCLSLFTVPGKFCKENHISFLQKGTAGDYSLYPPLLSLLESCCISLAKTEQVGIVMFKMTVGTYCSSCITL